MIEAAHPAAVALALGASFAGACHNLFIRTGTQRRTVSEAYFVVMTISAGVLVPVVAVAYYPEYGLTPGATLSFLAAGVLGTLIGMVCLYASIERIGASRTTPIVASNAVVATLLGILLLGETLTSAHGAGIVLIVGGVGAIAWETSRENPADLSRRELVLGLVLPFGAALSFGLEPIFASVGFAAGTPAPVGLALKTAAAWLGFTLYLGWHDGLPAVSAVRGDAARWLVLAGLANTLFLVGYYLGLELAPVNVVVPIVITNSLFVVILSALFMPRRLERVSWRLVTGATVVVLGAVVVTVSG